MTITKDIAPGDPGACIALHPDPSHDAQPRALRSWPVLLLALPAFVAVWSGWVGLGELTGFGPVRLLPGIADNLTINTAITLPIGMEVYAAYALYVWLSGRIRSDRTRSYAKWSALGGLVLGAAGQVAYHLMQAAGIASAPWPVTVLVACLPVAVLGMGAALAHLVHADAQPVRTDAHVVRNPDPVRTLSVRQVHTETHETATELTAAVTPDAAVRTDPEAMRSAVHSADRWAVVAERLCSADPSGRRDPGAVASILRLRHDNGWPHARIAEHVECSTSTVSRTLAAARTLTEQ
ncbi:helix-turn-helix domain-containing protein [Nocardia wallacei]|uniref:helix-turn-helix domain-containing protein n=1 Tax=Nocardia wallacei TaxID=480035 RepID=UPI0024569390|nr:helix-turn-helix domain-containing protein [Nocardia wallacei]